MTTFYKKVGRRYIPVKEYDNELMDSYQRGTHLVVSAPGHRLTRYNIKPEFAPMIAAGTFAKDKMAKVLIKASDLRPSGKILTPEQRKAWKDLSIAFGEDSHALQWPSALEAIEEGLEAMCQEAEQMLSNETVRKAYDHFMLVCELSK